MLNKADFIDYILNGGESETKRDPVAPVESALPEGFEGFDDFATETTPAPQAPSGSSFARRLLEATGFGNPAFVQRANVIRSGDAVARLLPERVAFWPKTPSRPYQTLLFEADLDHEQLLNIPAFKSRTLAHLDIVEDALARLVSEALDGFQRGGEGVTADVRKGSKEETLCVVSILDKREGQAVRLICFGTQNQHGGGLETFLLTEQTRRWDGQLAREHLGLLYERQFKKLMGQDWQEAFTTTEERKQAEKLLAICTGTTPQEHDIQEGVLDLLDSVAKGFGLRKKANAERRLQAFALPSDHDIGIDPEERQNAYGGQNPFGGVTLRDGHNRLLGYIVYPLKSTADAARLRRHLLLNNRFHNVLVVYPDRDQASIELWQGREQLTGKLRKGQGYKDAADVVNLLSRFFVVSKAKVRNPTELAQELAYRARYLRRLAVKQLEDEPEQGPLRNLYKAFKEALVHDQTEEEFSDAFSQTITYGLLTARWTGNGELMSNGERFTRQTALKHLPAVSTFLNDLFKSVLSVKLDEQRGRLLWLIDDIADLLDRIDVTVVFGVGDKDSDTSTDPVIHFYEPFLAAYDKDLKNKRGVFFTPRPVVSYIVRSIHELLQTEFGLEDGLASTDTWGDVSKRIARPIMPESVKDTDPFVCILDPATGTGTFICECIEVIEPTMKERWCRELNITDWKAPVIKERWNAYVADHLLPRLNAYEVMVASYAIAHLKLTLKLADTGFYVQPGTCLNVYLTNSLEPATTSGNPKLASLFSALASEAQEVDKLKRGSRYTVVVGNPPYSKISGNLSSGAVELVKPFRFVDGQRIVERGALALELNLQDDYVKFWGLLYRILNESKVGVGGFITNSRYLTSPSLRGLRFAFSQQFARGFFLDIGGQISERPIDGAVDENVFDIEQGVAIGIVVKSPSLPTLSSVSAGRLLGTRTEKYNYLNNATIINLDRTVELSAPGYCFSRSADEVDNELSQWPSLEDLMPFNSGAIITSRDNLAIDFDQAELLAKIDKFAASKINDQAILRDIGFSVKAKWNVEACKKEIRGMVDRKSAVRAVLYRPFDTRHIFYLPSLLDTPSKPVCESVFGHNNLVLLTPRVKTTSDFSHVFVSVNPAEKKACSHDRATQMFPLFCHTKGLLGSRCLNISTHLCCGRGSDSIQGGLSSFEYLYATLYSPGYRVRYGNALRDSYPRIPIARNRSLFLGLSKIGKELIGLHTLQKLPMAAHLGVYQGTRNPVVTRITYENNTVLLDSNNEQNGFYGIDKLVWAFDLGGYQVCHKWLKDRKGRTLSDDDIAHYHKIVVALSETIRLMGEIDEVIDQHGGWPDAFVTSTTGNDA